MADLQTLNDALQALWHQRSAGNAAPQRKQQLEQWVSPDAVWHLSAPIETCIGPEGIESDLVAPLMNSLSHLHRRPALFIGGHSALPGQEGDWAAGYGHLVGNFDAPLLGLQPTGHLVFLRYGEFYRLEDNRVTEARIIIDWVDFMRQIGAPCLPHDLGTEIQFPAPASSDGVRLAPEDPAESARTLKLVEDMLGDLRSFDPETFESAGQSGTGGYWHDDMLWYGPGGIGSNLSYDGFQKDHRIPFLSGFPDRVGGNHFARFGAGPYAASGGWPSITATHGGDYLGVPATHKSITMRVMDFWRAQDDQLIENWVFIDLIDLFSQLGVDLLARGRDAQV